MAEEEELERIFTIPLRATKKIPAPKRTNHAITSIRKYIAKHMKGALSDVWIDEPVNRMLWARGKKHPPSSIRVKAVKFEDNLIEVTLPED
jgi:large subunit ribosomal protein L31e